MSTSGIYGFRKNGRDKISYNRHNSHPIFLTENGTAMGLGVDVTEFCRVTPVRNMVQLFDAIHMVDEGETPTMEAIEALNSVPEYETGYKNPEETNWYNLLREIQGDLAALKFIFECTGRAYMTDAYDFITDSAFCEYGYIINLDSGKLEFWRGLQHLKDDENRYGDKECNGYYPCRMIRTVSLEKLYLASEEDVHEMLFEIEKIMKIDKKLNEDARKKLEV